MKLVLVLIPLELLIFYEYYTVIALLYICCFVHHIALRLVQIFVMNYGMLLRIENSWHIFISSPALSLMKIFSSFYTAIVEEYCLQLSSSIFHSGNLGKNKAWAENGLIAEDIWGKYLSFFLSWTSWKMCD